MMASSARQLIATGCRDSDDIDDDHISIGDIRSAFLVGEPYKPGDEPRYVKYRAYKGAQWRVYRLRKSLYGSADAPHRFYTRLSKYLEQQGFKQGSNDKCVYTHPDTGLRVGTHVDDLLVRGKAVATKAFWTGVEKEFGLKGWAYVTPETPRKYCGYNVSMWWRDGVAWYGVDQDAEVDQLLTDEGVWGARSTAPMPNKSEIYADTTPCTASEHKWYRSMVGSLQWFAVMSRWDISYAVARAAQFLSAPTRGAVKAVRRILAYLSQNKEFRLEVPRVMGTTYDVFSDSDHAGDRATGPRSHTGVVVMANGMPIQWRSNKQPVTSISSAQAEIYALSEACKDAKLCMWVGEEIGVDVVWPCKIGVDNAAGVSFQKATTPTSKLKGVYDLRWSWVEELQDSSVIQAIKVGTAVNVADIFTKCLDSKTSNTLVECVRSRSRELAKL
jgi:hypothetical protein